MSSSKAPDSQMGDSSKPNLNKDSAARLADSARNDSAQGSDSLIFCHDILNAINDAIFVHDAGTGRLIEGNHRMCDLFGYTREEILSLTIDDWSAGGPRYTHERAMELFARVIAGEPQVVDWHCRHKSGRLFWAEVSLSRATIAERDVVIAVVRDVTERKLAEDKFRIIATNTPDHVLIQDRELRYTWVLNPQLGLSVKGMVGKTDRDILAPEDADRLTEIKRQVLESGEPTYITVPLRSLSGDVQYFEGVYVPRFGTDGSIDGIIGYFRNVTEQKRTEEALRESEALLTQSQRVAQLGHYVYDICAGTWTSSQTLDALFGIEPDYRRSLEGWLNIVHPQDRDMMFAYLRDSVLGAGEAFDKEYRIVRVQNREVRWVRGLGQLECDANGQIVRMFGVIQDITDYKLAQDAIAESEERYRAFFENSIDAVLITSPTDGSISAANAEACRIFGMTEAELIAGGRGAVIDHSDPRLESALEIRTTTGRFKGELRFRRKDGSTFPADVSSGTFADQHGRLATVMVVRDITARKLAEDALNRKTMELDRVFSLSLDLLSVADTDGRLITVNPAWEELLGYRREELEGRQFLDYVHPDDVQKTIEALAKLRQGEPVIDFVNRYRCYDGSYRWIEWRSAPHQGNLIYAAARDITERKLAEDSLRESRNLLTRAQEITHIGHWRLNPATGVVEGSDELFRIFGLSRDDFAFESFVDSVDPADRDFVVATIQRSVENGEFYDIEHWLSCPDGTRRFVRALGEPVLDENGRVVQMVGTVQDITERKLVEESLRESQHFNESVLQTTPDLVYIYDLVEHRNVYANREMVNILGYSPEEVQQMGDKLFHLILHPDDIQRVADHQAKLFHIGDEVLEVEYRMEDSQGSWRWLRSRDKAFARNDDGSVRQIIGTATDITEAKRLAEALEHRVLALTRPLDAVESITFEELFNIDEIQELQDQFAEATGVASIITHTDGTPITRPSNFCRLCEGIIRKTEKGLCNCQYSDSVIGSHHTEGPVVQPCLSGGLWDAGASITVGGRHIANWLIGQVRNKAQSEEKMAEYARKIGVDEGAFLEAFREVPTMSEQRFREIAQALYTLAGQLSTMAYQNVQQARFIAEQKRSEEAIAQSQAYLSALVESTSDMIWSVDPESFGLLTYNSAVARYLKSGYGIDIRVGLKPQEMFTEQYVGLWTQRYRKALSDGHLSVEHQLARSGRYIELTLNTVVRDGIVKGISVLGKDVTERKLSEQALAESEEKLRAIYENAPVAIFQSTLDGRLMSTNPTAARVFGYDSVEELLETCNDIARAMFVDPEKRKEMVRAALGADGYVQSEIEYRRKDGSTLIANLYMRVVRDEGVPAFVEGFVEDITERRRAEQEKRALEQSMEEHKRKFYRDTILSVTDGKLLICDTSEIDTYVCGSQTSTDVLESADVGTARHEVERIMCSAGFDEERRLAFILGVGEAVTNALKHAGGGKVYAGLNDEELWVVVSDEGPGIESLLLPGAVLRRGFSTKVSMGMGYSIMMDVADRILLKTDPTGTTVVLVQSIVERPVTLEGIPDTWGTVLDMG